MEKGIFEALRKEKEREGTSYAEIAEKFRVKKESPIKSEGVVKIKKKEKKVNENVKRLSERLSTIQKLFIKKYQG